MTAVNPPIFMESSEYHSYHLRFGLNIPFDLPLPIGNPDNDSGYPHSGGVFPNVTGSTAETDNPLRVTSTGGLGISVDAGTAIIESSGIGGTMPGAYVGRNSGPTTLTLAARDASNPRKDIIYAGFSDAANGGTGDTFVIAARTGNPGASPSPNITTSIGTINRWIPLAVVTVPATNATPQAVTIADRRQFVAARGGVRVVRDANQYGDNPHWGDLRFDLSNDTLQMFEGHGRGWGPIATRGWAFGYEDNLRDHWRPTSVQHNALKRTTSANFDGTPGVETSPGSGNFSPGNASDFTTGAFQTPTGRAVVMVTATMRTENAQTNCRIGFRIQNEAGNEQIAASTNNSAVWPFQQNGTATWTGTVSGLNAATRADVSGSNPSQNRMFARMMFMSTGGGTNQAYFQDCTLTVIPIV